jgi:hypothetical protein
MLIGRLDQGLEPSGEDLDVVIQEDKVFGGGTGRAEVASAGKPQIRLGGHQPDRRRRNALIGRQLARQGTIRDDHDFVSDGRAHVPLQGRQAAQEQGVPECRDDSRNPHVSPVTGSPGFESA